MSELVLFHSLVHCEPPSTPLNSLHLPAENSVSSQTLSEFPDHHGVHSAFFANFTPSAVSFRPFGEISPLTRRFLTRPLT